LTLSGRSFSNELHDNSPKLNTVYLKLDSKVNFVLGVSQGETSPIHLALDHVRKEPDVEGVFKISRDISSAL